jgi:hypothetical protein
VLSANDTIDQDQRLNLRPLQMNVTITIDAIIMEVEEIQIKFA